MLRRLLTFVGILLILAVAGCGATAGNAVKTDAAETQGSVATTAKSLATTSAPTSWDLKPFVVPTLPAKLPELGSVDPATGLHVNAFPKVVVDLATFRLKVDGKVVKPLSLSYDDLRRLPKVTASPDLVCAGNFIDRATWSGVPLMTVLDMAEIQPGAKEINLKAADGYSIAVSLKNALRPENFLAYELMGQPLPVLHGFPLRAVFPGLNGFNWAKWLVEIDVE